MIPEDAQFFSLVVSVDLEICDEKTHGVEIIAAMAVSWKNKRLSQNLAFFPKTSHVQRNLGCCSRCFPLLSKKDVCTFSYYLPESKKIHFSDFLRIERTHLGLQNPTSGVFCGRTIYGRQKHNRKNPQSPHQKNTAVKCFCRAMSVQRQVSLPWVEIHGESTCPASSGSCRVYECWNLIRQPENMKHAMLNVWFWYVFVVAFASLFD